MQYRDAFGVLRGTPCPDSEPTQPLTLITPAGLACDRWMKHGRQQAEKRKQKEQTK